jgi:hypothetical protein
MESMCSGDNLLYLDLVKKYPQFQEDVLVRLPGAGRLGDILLSEEDVVFQMYHMPEREKKGMGKAIEDFGREFAYGKVSSESRVGGLSKPLSNVSLNNSII